jgi:hypothetical protein
MAIEQLFEHPGAEVLIGEIESTYRQESVVMARRMGSIADLLALRTDEAQAADPDPGYAMITGFARASAEVGAVMNMAPMVASRIVAQAEALDERLPRIAALLGDAVIDWRSTQLIITRTELVSDELITAVDDALAACLGEWECWSRRRLINKVDSIVRTVDPDAAKERRARAEGDRYLNLAPQPDGTAVVRGRITATAAAAFQRRVHEMLGAVCGKDSRTVDQRRADAFTALVEGRRLCCDCGRPDCPARPGEDAASEGAVRTVINVIAGQDTVTGDSERPGYVEGFGVIDADLVRELAEGAAMRLIESPEVSAAEAFRYQPSAEVARWIRLRDFTCRFPGCDRPVAICDLDHTTPFNHADPGAGGLTVPWGLAAYCRQHHRLKTFHSGPNGWQDEQLADGTIVWTSPTGRLYRTTPGGSELFPEMGPACVQLQPQKRNRSKDRAARIRAMRRKLREQRPINAAQRRLDRERRREIDLRKWRNYSRKLLFVVKGGRPRTSPFCPWINEPLEPEDLPPDWRPPPPPPQTDTDEPPF